MNKTEIVVKRNNGDVEIIDVTAKFKVLGQNVLNRIALETKKGGRGQVIKAVLTYDTNNLLNLQKEYNNVNNEGCEGYVPDADYFEALPSYKTWIQSDEIFPAK